MRPYRRFVADTLVGLFPGKLGYDNNYLLSDLASNDLLRARREVRAREVKAFWHQYLDEQDGRARKDNIGLYVASPYCKAKCDFCFLHKFEAGSGTELEDYKNRLIEHFRYHSDVTDRIVFSSVYFGGGSPSIFSSDQLEDIFKSLFGLVRLRPECEVNFESNPVNLDPAKLKVIRRYPFNRLTLGLQSLHPEVLKRNNRGYQTLPMLKKVFSWCRELGFGFISTDLILGLYGDTAPRFLESFQRLLEFGPEEIIIYPCQPTRSYLERRFSGSRERFYRHLQKASAAFAAMKDRAERSGYRTDSAKGDVLRLREAAGIQFYKTRSARPPRHEYLPSGKDVHSVLGFGFHADSTIYGRHKYHSTPLHADPDENTYVCNVSDPGIERALFVLDSLGRGSTVSIMDFEKEYSTDFEQAFPGVISELTSNGWASISGRGSEVRLKIEETDPRKVFSLALYFFPFQDIVARLNGLLGEDAAVRLQIGDRTMRARVQYSPDPGACPENAFRIVPDWGEGGKGSIETKLAETIERFFMEALNEQKDFELSSLLGRIGPRLTRFQALVSKKMAQRL